ncbi:protein ALP1-like, partial [Anoplophora glabripennis]|uniref:protein ALP1-like n=1 Tax=Anoplophora glabripennis TaxID=217634 RepID=UPI000C7564D3
VVGAIDGTNIKFKAPLEQQDSYIDKNDTHSIKLQAICTSQKIFINIMAGFPGSAHDSRVFKNSEIYQELLRGNKRKYFPTENYHLIGDKAYPLMDWLMKPYLGDDRHLTRQQRAHNLAHSQTRIRIEHCFGLLKGRWLILQYVNVRTIEKAVKIITACCVLHNFCYLNGDTWDEGLIDEDETDGEYDGDVEQTGMKKREIYQELRGNKRKYFPTENYHLIGDKAYPLMDWLMKPYLGDDRHLTRQQRAHNLAHSQTRIRIEHCFGLLKGRWLILQYVNVRTIEKAVKIITACCVLHNFCYLNGDSWDEGLIDEDETDGEYDGGVEQTGMRKRDQISQLFR